MVLKSDSVHLVHFSHFLAHLVLCDLDKLGNVVGIFVAIRGRTCVEGLYHYWIVRPKLLNMPG
jgi:hypothetical protein